MKKLCLLVLSCFMFSCATSQEAKTEETKVNKAPEILIGKYKREALSKVPFDSWFVKNYESYLVDQKSIDTLNPLLKGVKVKIFMGTWCGDSKRETPRFYKIMDAAQVKEKNITLITMDRSKKTPDNFEEGLDITNVPTFIFYKNGKEVNRIVEYPIKSLEKDMITILSGQEYKHAYAN
ncbi:thioredoxin family protein [Ascidiimonas sp. W6]|uniref:thioredoxin family protein n=1 Tax=Ascidiimonas meishanensis TaxID=3128903 RepID=UPI0030EF7477